MGRPRGATGYSISHAAPSAVPQLAHRRHLPPALAAVKNQIEGENGADGGTRTHDLRITNALLYQLSYIGAVAAPCERTAGPAFYT